MTYNVAKATASDLTLINYTIEVESQPKPTTWTTITSQGTDVNFGELGAWDTTAVLDVDYRLRLSGYQHQLVPCSPFLNLSCLILSLLTSNFHCYTMND